MQFVVITLIIILSLLILLRKRYESFDNPQTATQSQEGSGSSELYGWGFSGITDKHKRTKRHKQICPKCDYVYLTDEICNITIDDRDSCKYCDITKNKDIDKYVLKSSIPPCPDMSEYAKKSMLQPTIDMNKYILKTEIPKYCSAYMEKDDRYMLKTKCRPCDHKHKIVYGDITKHPDFHKYVSKEHCKQYKKSWIQNFEEWLESLGSGKNKHQRNNNSGYPTGYSFSPYAGFGTNNIGYALDGSKVSERHLYSKERD